MGESERATTDDDRDLSKQYVICLLKTFLFNLSKISPCLRIFRLETNMQNLNSLLDQNKIVKKAVQERLENNKEEITNLIAQVS